MPGKHDAVIGERRRPLVPLALLSSLPMFVWQAAFFGGALVTLVLMSFWTVVNYRLVPGFGLDAWTSVTHSRVFWTAYGHSLLLATVSGLIAVVLAFPVACKIALSMSRRWQRIFMLALVLPYFTSFLVRSYAWRFALEQEGVINSILVALHFEPIAFPGSLAALIIGYLANFLPLVTLILILGLSGFERNLIEAAANLGAKRVQTFFTVILPLSKAPLVLGFAFGFMLALGDYVTPAYLGDGLWPTLPGQIVDSIQGRSNFPRAAVIGLITLATLLTVLFFLLSLAFRSRVNWVRADK